MCVKKYVVAVHNMQIQVSVYINKDVPCKSFDNNIMYEDVESKNVN